MSSNPYTTYYVNQAGSGIPGFQGVRFQKGAGFFGNIFQNAILPLLKYFGKKALNTGVDVASDTLGGEKFIDSLKTRANATARNIASDVSDRAMKFAQTGKGKRRKRRNKNKPTKKIIKKTAKRRRRKTKRTKKSIKLNSSIFN